MTDCRHVQGLQSDVGWVLRCCRRRPWTACLSQWQRRVLAYVVLLSSTPLISVEVPTGSAIPLALLSQLPPQVPAQLPISSVRVPLDHHSPERIAPEGCFSESEPAPPSIQRIG
jgi:hypothetical protein